MKKLIVLPAIIAVSMLFNACKKDDDNTPNPPPGNTRNLVLNISGLGDLGSTAQYEGWIIVNGTPVSTGKFTVNQNGVLSKTHFPVNNDQLNSATAFVLTIEPVPDNSPIPHDRHILAGEFSGNSAALTTIHGEALGADLTSATGTYILATTSSIYKPNSAEFISRSRCGRNLPGLKK